MIDEKIQRSYQAYLETQRITSGMVEDLLTYTCFLIDNQQFDNAQALCQALLTYDAKLIPAYKLLYELSYHKMDYLNAINYGLKAIELSPYDALLYGDIATLYIKSNNLEQAKIYNDKALNLAPTMMQARLNAALLAEESGDLDTAKQNINIVLNMDPSNANAIFNMGNFKLRYGDFAEGWQYYRARFFTSPNFVNVREVSSPLWKGEDIQNETLLVLAEQGVGDTIAYASMFTSLINYCKHCIIECEEKLIPCLTKSFPVIEFISKSTPSNALPHHDKHIPGWSLGTYLRNTVESFPKQTGYLHYDSDKAKSLREKYQEQFPGKQLIGISWHTYSADYRHTHSIDINQLLPLIDHPEIQFFNLQYIHPSEKLSFPKNINLFTDLDIDHFNDIDNSLAQIAAMDLIISVDNSIAILASALGKETWGLFCKIHHFLWHQHENSSLWFPNTQIFTQTDYGNWEPLITLIYQKLSQLSA